MKSVALSILVLLWLIQNSVLAQTVVKGRILDEKNHGISYATIYVESEQKGTTSNSEGYFEIKLGNGDFTISISSVGFVAQKIDDTIENAMKDLGDIHLEYANEIVDEVVVSASRKLEKITQSPATVNLITAPQFENFAGSPEELFALQKGVDFSRQGNFWSSISIRGFNSAFNQKILILDDNRIANLRIRTPVGPFSAFVKEDVELVLVGYPVQMNNQPSESIRYVNPFLKKFQEKYTIPVKLMDERFTSKMAFQTMIDAGLKKKERRDKALVDGISATIILQSYLEGKKYI